MLVRNKYYIRNQKDETTNLIKYCELFNPNYLSQFCNNLVSIIKTY